MFICDFFKFNFLFYSESTNVNIQNENLHLLDIDFISCSFDVYEYIRRQNLLQLCSQQHRTKPLKLNKKSRKFLDDMVQLTVFPALFIPISFAAKLRSTLFRWNIHSLPATKRINRILFLFYNFFCMIFKSVL